MGRAGPANRTRSSPGCAPSSPTSRRRLNAGSRRSKSSRRWCRKLAAALLETDRRRTARATRALSTHSADSRISVGRLSTPIFPDQAVEEMLIQHLLTERIFRRVFDNPDFVNRNVIAREIEEGGARADQPALQPPRLLPPAGPLLRRHRNDGRHDQRLFGEAGLSQHRLRAVLPGLFGRGGGHARDCVHAAGDRRFHGAVGRGAAAGRVLGAHWPTPASICWTRSWARAITSCGSCVHLAEIGRLGSLPHKYAHELHCNEVMLLPYYIAAMNIEHEYYELTGQYAPFDGICLVDTFELAEEIQMGLFAPENTARVQAQQGQEITVIIGNPPYNVGQVNENDNNKNRKYATMDRRVRETYSKDSKATNKNALADPYVKAVRWAADRIGEEGIVAFVSNNGFLDGVATDGMRKHLATDFDAIYVLDLGGNVRKNPKLSGTTHNVFGIQVGGQRQLFCQEACQGGLAGGDLLRTRRRELAQGGEVPLSRRKGTVRQRRLGQEYAGQAAYMVDGGTSRRV